MEHLTKEEFNAIVAKGGMFKLSDEMFYGTIDQFDECFGGYTYDDVIIFADSMDCIVSEYTQEEHEEYLRSQR